MSNIEMLKLLKNTNENLEKIKDLYITTFKEDNKIDSVLNVLYDVYENTYEKAIKRKENIKTKAICPRCGKELNISDIIDYSYFCENCDENFYICECEKGEKWWLDN